MTNGVERLAYSVAEVQQTLGIPSTAAYVLARRIGTKLGRRWVISRERLDALLRGELPEIGSPQEVE